MLPKEKGLMWTLGECTQSVFLPKSWRTLDGRKYFFYQYKDIENKKRFGKDQLNFTLKLVDYINP